MKGRIKRTLVGILAAATLATTGCHVVTKFRHSADFNQDGISDLVEIVEQPALFGSDTAVIGYQMLDGNYNYLRYEIGRNSTVIDVRIADVNRDGLPDIGITVKRNWPYGNESWEEWLINHRTFFSKEIKY